MTVLGIDHVQLAMPIGREDEARVFYSGLLGIPEVPKPPHLVQRGGAWFEAGPLKVHLGVERDFRPAQKAHPGLLVAELDALLARLRGAGVSITEGDPLDGGRRVYVDDCFGNRIELIEVA
jgi:catechol 2,3-dioxygenase-like lactoylglutathione lyase family enzyme